MKVLYFNALYELGHKYIDKKNIYNLSRISELTVLEPKGWYDEMLEGVTYKESAWERNRKYGRIDSWICALKNCRAAAKLAKVSEIDIIIFGEYELITILIALLFFQRDARIIVYNHNNIDQLEYSAVKRYIFSKLKNKVYNCVLEPFIKDMLLNRYGVQEERILVWPHPIERDKENADDNIIYDCVGISNSNDEQTVKDILENEIKFETIKKSGKHIILRTKTLDTFDNGFLTIIKGWISQERYEKYINQTQSILVSFPTSFRYRVSATVLEGLINKKIIVGADVPLMRYYADKYPSLCFIYKNGEVLDAIESINKHQIDMQSYDAFLQDHSDIYLQRVMEKDLKKIQK